MSERIDPDNRTPDGRVSAPRGQQTRVDDRDVVDVREGRSDVGVREARARFGGLDVPASLAGMLVAVSSLLLLSGIASAAIGAIAYQTGITGNEEELSVGGLITAGVVIFTAFLIGGWASGRMARYSGALNGLMVAAWFVVLLAVLAALGALISDSYNLFGDLRVAEAQLPNWFSDETASTGALISAVVFAAVMVLGAVAGGLWGQRFHRRADDVIARTRQGGIRGERTSVEERR